MDLAAAAPLDRERERERDMWEGGVEELVQGRHGVDLEECKRQQHIGEPKRDDKPVGR